MCLSDHRLLTVHEHRWKYADKSGAGSHVACLRQPLSSTKPARIEPLFVPHDIDFTLPLGKNQRYTKIGSQFFWVPQYRSNLEEEYERPGKAIFKSVQLAPLQKEYFISFEEACEISNDTAHEKAQKEGTNETRNFCNENLQHFLSILTGWNLVVIFAASDVKPKSWGPSFTKRPRPADVLCFRNGQETRVAIRRKDPDKEYTMDWTSASLIEAHVNTVAEELYLTLTSRQTGRTLALATVTAASGEAEKIVDKTEIWVVTVTSGSGELRSTIVVSPISRCRHILKIRHPHPSVTEQSSTLGEETGIAQKAVLDDPFAQLIL